MNQNLVNIALVVRDYDEAINFYVGKLNFELIEDLKQYDNKRWVIVAPKGKGNFRLLLAKAVNDEQNQELVIKLEVECSYFYIPIILKGIIAIY